MFDLDWHENKLTLSYADRAASGNDAVSVEFQEQTPYDVWLRGIEERDLAVYLAEQEYTRDLRWQGQTAYWQLNFGNYVGASALRITLDGAEVLNLPVIVRSKKMGYEDDYRKMLDEISAQLAALIFAFDTPTATYMAPQTVDPHIAYLDYLFLRDLMRAEKLPRRFALVAHDPERHTEREPVWADIAQARQLTPAMVEAMFAYPEWLTRPRRAVAPMVQRALRGYAPREVRDTRVMTTWDTPANRFVKHFLRGAELKLHGLRQIFQREAARFSENSVWAKRSAELAQECAGWGREVANMRRAPFLEEVGEMHIFPASNQVLLKREGYRELRAYYAQFLLTGKVRWEGLADLIRAPNKDCATLYEYWVFFKLIEIIAGVWGARLTAGDFIRTNGEVFQVNLFKGVQTHAAFSAATLYYNRSYTRRNRGVYSRSLCPDYVLEFDDYAVVFDAKYRYTKLSEFMGAERATFKPEDLYKMHTYRDAIKRARAVFILYPGSQVVCFGVDGKMWKSGELEELPRDFAGVGAIPLRIDDDSALRAVLTRLLGNVRA